MKKYRFIGLMSGTSLDGLDIVYVEFKEDTHENYSFELINNETKPYPENLFIQLSNVTELNALQFVNLDVELGVFFAECVNDFIKKYQIEKNSDLIIASHGHTIFHQPEKGFTSQIGNGQHIASKTGLKVITNFREKDVVYGGQGAPLVPKGDFDLFSEKAASFLNIGGFSNISFVKDKDVIAYDVCPGNLPLNCLVNKIGLKFDKNGNLASKGEVNFFLLDLLNELPYYTENNPKSLGVEWLETHFLPLIKEDKTIESNLRTIVEHISLQISNELTKHDLQSVFITGGGALNRFLIERIKHYYKGEVIIPNESIISFKEAIIFAYLGLKRLKNETNCISTVTGAKENVIGGIIYEP